jgi:hypothetical protein
MSDISSTFEYKTVGLKDIVVRAEQTKTGRANIRSVSLDGHDVQPTSRFWTSIFAKYGFNNQFFKYFDYGEVFGRIAERAGSDKVRVCVESNTVGTKTTERALAATGVDKSLLPFDEMLGLVKEFGGEKISYHNGVIESFHSPRFDGGSFSVSGDEFSNKFVLQLPIDGFGDPSIYLSLLRQVCENGAIGLAKAFRSMVKVGKGENNVFALTKAIEGFNNEEGFAAIRQRFESAANSWASVYETAQLYKTLARVANQEGLTGGDSTLSKRWLSDTSEQATYTSEDLPVFRAFHKMTGDTALTYGISNMDALTVKKQRTLPVKCSMYDVLNFATEVATHHSTAGGSRILQAWVGQAISSEYDMEGTKERFGEFADFHIDRNALAVAAN